MLIAVDLTGDRKVDLVVGGSTNTISIFPGKGDGAFLPAVVQLAGWSPHAAAAVDLDGDGRLDLVTANGEFSTVSVLLATAQGGAVVQRGTTRARHNGARHGPLCANMTETPTPPAITDLQGAER